MRYVIVGDVHGCIDELDELLLLADLKPMDTFVSVGDLVDRGPDSAAVVRRMREIRAVCVVGNHDMKHVKYHKRLLGNPEATAKPELVEIEKQLTQEDKDWMRAMPLFYRIPSSNAIVIHGGWSPALQEVPMNPYILGNMPTEQRKLLFQTPWVRFVEKSGKMIQGGTERKGDAFWADHYDGRFGLTFFGHQPWYNGHRVFPYAIGLDTACCFGSCLTAAVYENGVIVDYITVPAKQTYASRRLDFEEE